MAEQSPDVLMTGAEVAAYLRIPFSTLPYWRRQGDGPPAIQVGRRVRYRASDVEAWLRAQHRLMSRFRRQCAECHEYKAGSAFKLVAGYSTVCNTCRWEWRYLSDRQRQALKATRKPRPALVVPTPIGQGRWEQRVEMAKATASTPTTNKIVAKTRGARLSGSTPTRNTDTKAARPTH